MLSTGTRLGVYEIIEPLGKGGMGEVYLANDPRLNRQVAIKVLPQNVANEEALKRFQREAKSLAALSHINIVPIYDTGMEDGIPYIVMELLHGTTLREHLKKGPLPPAKIFQIAAMIADGLSVAHAKGIIHRDLKPENIFITSEDIVKLLDFGIARFRMPIPAEEITSASTIASGTEQGRVIGTVPYMSPEQVRGQVLDARSDLFSFGAILYEMLTGKYAFQRPAQVETLAAILKEDPPEIPEIPGTLKRILDHCLEKDPAKRFQSARDLLFALQSTAQTAVTDTPRYAKQRIQRWIYVIFFIILMAGAGLLYRDQQVARKPQVKSIAVLPFANLSPNRQYEYFSDGVTEDVVTHLSKIRELHVISRTSTMQYKNSKKSLREIAKELGVNSILEGSVRREGNRVRIVGQLIDAETDSHLWAETYDRELKDIFEIQSDVAQQIAQALQVKLQNVEDFTKKPTENIQAYDYYLRGLEAYRRWTGKDVDQSIELFQKAIELDPELAVARAWLSSSYVGKYGFTQEKKWLPLAEQAARETLSLDPRVPEAFVTLGRIYEVQGKYTIALEHFLKAQNVDPNYARSARRVAELYSLLGKNDEALRWCKKSVLLDPLDSAGYASLGSIYHDLYDFDQAERNALRSVQMSPRSGFQLIIIYLSKKDKTKAANQLNEMIAGLPDPVSLPYIGFFELCLGNMTLAKKYFEKGPQLPIGLIPSYGLILLKEGKKEEAYKMIDEALHRQEKEMALHEKIWADSLDRAALYAVRGNDDEAFRWLTESVDQANTAAGLNWIPAFERLRNERRFQDLLAEGKRRADEMRRRAEQNQDPYL